jgi:hypothetical protein
VSDSESGHILCEQRIPVAGGSHGPRLTNHAGVYPMPDINTAMTEVRDAPTTACPGAPDL